MSHETRLNKGNGKATRGPHQDVGGRAADERGDVQRGGGQEPAEPDVACPSPAG